MAISRRAFIKRTLGAGAVLYLYANGGYKIVTAATGPEAYRLRIVHTNDHHAHIDPVAVTIQGTPSVTRNFGGVARRKTVFDQIRAEATNASATDPLAANLLFLDAGDVFQGTLYFNLYKGQADLEFYNALGYDVTAVGNHEFDNGDQTFVDYLKNATFPIIAANITAGSGPLQSLITGTIDTPPGQLGPAIIKTIGTEKIGIFGITTQETKVSSSPGADTNFLDPIATATDQVAKLKAAGATKIIALTHIGYALDIDLAKKVRGIDIIVGGHSHTPLEPTAGLGPVGIASAGPYPTMQADPDGKMVPIVTDWEWGKWAGDVTLSLNAGGEILTVTGAPKPLWADGIANGRALLAGEQPEIVPDPTFQNIIDTKYKPGVDNLGKTKIGSTTVLLDGGSGVYRTRETNGGDLIADALQDKALNLALGQAGIPIITIINSGGVRAPINVGDITTGDVLTVLPFGNTIASVDITGAQVIAALENGVSQVEATAGRFPQVAGIKFSWTRTGTPAVQASPAVGTTAAIPGVKGSRILAQTVQVYDTATKTFLPIDLAKTYRVITNNFVLTGGDGYNVFTTKGDQSDMSIGGGTNQLDTGLIMADIVEQYIGAHSPVVIATTGRILEVTVKAILPMIFGRLAAVAR